MFTSSPYCEVHMQHITLDEAGMDAIRRAADMPSTPQRTLSKRTAAVRAPASAQHRHAGEHCSPSDAADHRLAASEQAGLHPWEAQTEPANGAVRQISTEQDDTHQVGSVQPSENALARPDTIADQAQGRRPLQPVRNVAFTMLEPLVLSSPAEESAGMGCGGCFPRKQ